ncbi:hypothetical protein E1287_42950 [Actinomadura sp. KC06]|uniref:hypothetical protein n=1 Tax=Actinomadura sp. KC06 TaxID=2530369 RepID=UPI001051465A|nr:hypothetical protein [Actinomadura sp. KC06]TDD14092.1 hypothetical protein E1287_42950 [Actinomadura sp. KC06]
MGREIGVPASELSGSAFSLDHLFVDADAVPTLVKVKRASDTRTRREVVAQMLDYAANGSRYWPAQLLRQSFEDTCRRDGAFPEEIYQGALGGQGPDAFWENVRDNLLAGRLRLLFVADQIPVELRAIVEFLNKQMIPAEVLAVDLRRHRNETGLGVLAPTVYGNAAVTAKGPSASGRGSWTPAEGAGARLVSGSGSYPSVIAHYPITGRRPSTWNLSAHPGGRPALWINFGTLVNHLPADTIAGLRRRPDRDPVPRTQNQRRPRQGLRGMAVGRHRRPRRTPGQPHHPHPRTRPACRPDLDRTTFPLNTEQPKGSGQTARRPPKQRTHMPRSVHGTVQITADLTIKEETPHDRDRRAVRDRGRVR